MAFIVGDRVHSKRIGARAAFDGEVVEVREPTLNSAGQISFPKSYDVRDEAGQDWNRGEGELSSIAKAEAA